MIKRITALILLAIMIMNFGTIAFAENIDETSNGIYLLSEEVPVAVVEHMQNSLRELIGDILAISEVTVGKPFKIFEAHNTLYYFLVYADGKMVGTYRVFEAEDGYSGVFSEDKQMLNGLMQLSDITSINNPAKIVSGYYNDMYAVINDDVYTIIEDPFGNSTDPNSLLMQPVFYSSNVIVNIVDTIDVDFLRPSLKTSPAWKYLQLDLLETQSNLPWCTAYATSSIMRYKTGKSLSEINTTSIMEYAHPGKSKTELESLSLAVNKAIEYANQYEIYPKYVLHRRAYSAIASDIIANNPVMFVFDNLSTGQALIHVMVCRGYYDNNGDSYYSIWNPWYSYYERINTSDNIYYISNTGEAWYKWEATVYGWGQ